MTDTSNTTTTPKLTKVTYGDGIDPAAIELGIARQQALQAEAEAIAAETTVVRVEAMATAVPAEQQAAVESQLSTLEDEAAKARKKATRLAVLSPLSEDDVNVERRGHLDEQVRSYESQHASITAQISYAEKLLAITGANALDGDDKAEAEQNLKQLKQALEQTAPVVIALQTERDSLPPLPPEVQERLAERRGGPRGRRGLPA